ncbi:MAG: hypothetical protein WA197_24170 [Candidatus Acidiferrales bacterium]
MPIDENPINALKHQFEMENLSSSPVTGRVLQIASSLPLIPPPLKQAVEWLKNRITADAAERDRLMLETIAAEVVKHGEELERTTKVEADQPSRMSEEVLGPLLADAARKAESTRATERVRRIGLILANAMIETRPTDADQIEELMRVATELSDRDVEQLRELVRIEGDAVRTQGRITRYDAHLRWEQGWWGTRVLPELDSVFSKLESYGLVSRIAPPNNQNIMADYQNRYVLLPKGARFVVLIKSRAAV